MKSPFYCYACITRSKDASEVAKKRPHMIFSGFYSIEDRTEILKTLNDNLLLIRIVPVGLESINYLSIENSESPFGPQILRAGPVVEVVFNIIDMTSLDATGIDNFRSWINTIRGG